MIAGLTRDGSLESKDLSAYSELKRRLGYEYNGMVLQELGNLEGIANTFVQLFCIHTSDLISTRPVEKNDFEPAVGDSRAEKNWSFIVRRGICRASVGIRKSVRRRSPKRDSE